MRVRHVRKASAHAGSFAATCPNTTSACPVIAFVSDTTAKSAPRASGRCPSTVAVVLSTATSAPTACAAADSAAMSQTSSPGLVGDSSHSNDAPSSNARCASCAVGAICTTTPCAAKKSVAINRVV